MNQCKDIEKHLPLYDEGLLSDQEQKAVEEHLAVCADCRRELSFLRKTVQILGGLSPLEEPAWFQQ
ncbi:MAG: zf-HC2 domain-containing protein, partial [Syntrophaceae bacterium]|nr:zf-HC2 domain-containing protein [Syntrophaceae bacterium]